MTKTRRGEVVLVLFPNSDLRTAKRRPALVIQRNNLDSGLAQTIVVMISSNLARRGHPSRIFVGLNSAAGKTAGLRLDSVIMADNLATVLDSEIDSSLGNFPESVQIMLQSVSRDEIELEQYMDFLRNRGFRQTLLCRAEETIDRSGVSSKLARLRLASLHQTFVVQVVHILIFLDDEAG